MLPHLPRTVRGRFIMINCLLMIIIFLVFAFFSISIIQSTMHNQEQAYMESSMKLLAGQIDQEYQNIIQIAQHMTSAGAVGKQLNKMFSAESVFDLSEQKRVFDSILQTVTAVGHQVELAMYYDQSASEIYATNFPVKKTFSLAEGLSELKRTSHITFHATHTSQSRFSNHPVLSISWPSVYNKDKVLTIYVEVRTSIPALLDDLNRKNAGDYILVQLSQSGQLCYCSDPDFTDWEELEQIISSDNSSGSSSQLMWNKISSKYSFDYILLHPKQTFFNSIHGWTTNLVIALITAVILLVGSSALFSKIILQKLQMMVDVVDAVQRPELIMESRRTGLLEYDGLMDRFNDLLVYVRQLISEIKAHEMEKTKLELDKLYYQINPHFLMNSLNSLYWMARLNSQTKISDYVHHLMGMLSYSLGKTGGQPTIRKELNVIRDYVAMEQERHEFNVVYEVEENCYLDEPVPKLFLQPIVENAVSHGIDTEGTLTIRVKPEETGIIIEVEDDGCGIDPDKIRQLQSMEDIRKNAGIGLRYSVSMLQQFFGGRASILIRNGETRGTKVTITLDLQKEENHDPGTDH